MGDDLCEHRVVVRTDDRPRAEARVDSHEVGLAGQVERSDGAGRRQPSCCRVLGDDAHFDRVPVRRDELLAQRQFLARRHPQLQLDQVDAGDRFGHRMLHLQAGVDLEEVDRADAARFVDEKLDRACAVVPDRLRESNRTVTDGRPRLGRDTRRRRLLDDLLVAALDRALALAKVHDVAVHVADDLDFDVASPFDVWLHEDGPVTE